MRRAWRDSGDAARAARRAPWPVRCRIRALGIRCRRDHAFARARRLLRGHRRGARQCQGREQLDHGRAAVAILNDRGLSVEQATDHAAGARRADQARRRRHHQQYDGEERVRNDVRRRAARRKRSSASQGLAQINDEQALVALIRNVLAAQGETVAQYRAGKTASFGFLVGQVMKASAGKASPRLVNDLLRREIDGT